MDSIWFNFISFLTVYVFAIVSPGPNFILVVDRTLSESRRAGLFTALGVATGSGLFGFAGLVGLLVIINSLPNFAFFIRMIGGGYLVWLGFSMLYKSLRPTTAPKDKPCVFLVASPVTSWRVGLVTNLTNPKAWAFYFALFTVVIAPGFMLWHKVLLNGSMFLISFGWYALVAILISSPRFRPLFEKSQHLIQSVLGVLLIILGGRLFI